MEILPFDHRIAVGHAAEVDVAATLDLAGYTAMRIKKHDRDISYVGPEFVLRGVEYKIPDLWVCNPKISRLFEVKYKDVCSHYPSHQSWRVGIDYQTFMNYVKFNNNSYLKMALVFIVRGGMIKKGNAISPGGRYIQDLDVLVDYINRDASLNRADRLTSINPPLDNADKQLTFTDSEDEDLSNRTIYWDISLFENLYYWIDRHRARRTPKGK